MAKIVLTNASVVFLDGGGSPYDFSDLISSVSLSTTHDILDVTPVTNGGVIYKEVIAGVGTNSVSFDFYQDFANESLEEFFNGKPPYTLMPIRVGTKVNCRVRPNNAAISASNPEYQFEVLVTDWTSLNAQVGALSTMQVSWPISGAITKDITA
jgi:hypothetical protein